MLSLSARMTLIEQKLTQLEQDNEWWIDWKKNRPAVSSKIGKRNTAQSDEEEVEGAIGENLENSLNNEI